MARKGSDDCIGCHMPRSDSSNNAHVATTNHRVPRREDENHQGPVDSQPIGAARSEFVNFHRDLMSAEELRADGTRSRYRHMPRRRGGRGFAGAAIAPGGRDRAAG